MEDVELKPPEVKHPNEISIVYYCRDCSKVVSAKSMGRKKKYTFKCPGCSGVCAYGTSRGIISFFRIREGDDNWKSIEKKQTELVDNSGA
jgi:DNA-directed RNA polymerase subunit RPC12/RpoP